VLDFLPSPLLYPLLCFRPRSGNSQDQRNAGSAAQEVSAEDRSRLRAACGNGKADVDLPPAEAGLGVSLSLLTLCMYLGSRPGLPLTRLSCPGQRCTNKKRTKTLTTESARWLVGVKQGHKNHNNRIDKGAKNLG